MPELKNTIIALAALLIILLLCLTVSRLIRFFALQKLYRTGKRDSSFVYRLLKTGCPGTVIMRSVALPDTPENNGAPKCYIGSDYIIVGRGGVILLSALGIVGSISNPPMSSEWTASYNGSTCTFANPLLRAKPAADAINRVLKYEYVYNIPIRNAAVFYCRGAKLQSRAEELLSAEALINFVNTINKYHVISGSERRRTIRALNAHRYKRRKNASSSS